MLFLSDDRCDTSVFIPSDIDASALSSLTSVVSHKLESISRQLAILERRKADRLPQPYSVRTTVVSIDFTYCLDTVSTREATVLIPVSSAPRALSEWNSLLPVSGCVLRASYSSHLRASEDACRAVDQEESGQFVYNTEMRSARQRGIYKIQYKLTLSRHALIAARSTEEKGSKEGGRERRRRGGVSTVSGSR